MSDRLEGVKVTVRYKFAIEQPAAGGLWSVMATTCDEKVAILTAGARFYAKYPDAIVIGVSAETTRRDAVIPGSLAWLLEKEIETEYSSAAGIFSDEAEALAYVERKHGTTGGAPKKHADDSVTITRGSQRFNVTPCIVDSGA